MVSRRRGWVAVVIVVVLAGLCLIIVNPFAGESSLVNLSVVATGHYGFSLNGKVYVYPYANLTIRFASPSVLDPSRLNLTITGPGGKIAFGSSGILLSGIHMAYSENSYPHWIATHGGGQWTGYTATVINPDGLVVGGTYASSGTKDEAIESGAIMTLTFPISVNSVRGYVLIASYQGTPGTVSITLP
jgi:hypothetical protein